MRNQKLQQMDRIKEPKFGPATKRLLSSPKKVSPNLPGTGKAVYNPRPWAMTKAASVGDIGSSQESQSSRGASSSAAFTPDFDEDLKPPPKLHRTTSLPKKLSEPQAVTSLKVQREYKQLFTVVRNVKEAHECQEHGETQEFFDDIEYLLDGLRDVQSPSTRCLSCMGLATKSAMAAFRMHLRAHGVVTRIFTALHDACSHPSLALATATVMHMLSRDRLNMDLDKESLELMVKLLSVDAQYTSENVSTDREYQKTREKVTELLTQIKKEGGAKHLDLTDISTGKLAMESMLSLTSRKAGEWFKEELRALGGLDYFVQSVADCVDYFIMEDEELSESHVDKLRTIDRCLRVLENVTFMNTENQTYLIGCKNSTLITALCRGLKVCEGAMSQYTLSDTDSKTVDKNSTGYIIFHTLLSILRVLLNITHDNEFGSTKVGSQHGLLSTVLLCILQIPKYAPSDQKFDLLVLGLGLLINLVEHCDINRRLLMSTETVSSYDSTSQAGSLEAPEALVQLFLQRDEAARNAEAQDEEEADTSAAEGTSQETVDKSGEWRESESGIEWVVLNEDDPAALSDSDDEMEELPSSQDENDPLTKALHKAGKHMEDSIVASYVSLLIGCIIQNNKSYVERIQSSLPENGFDSMVKLLYKFLGFMNLTEAVGNSGGTSIKK
ncbi:wings apart-like protein homolog, partial [Lingula anatina]|uniref:Wings apart-like protein homolog n=1 Tax=Lingula anatina TaxID=7574 RepID=A0A1S3J538_LINAN